MFVVVNYKNFKNRFYLNSRQNVQVVLQMAIALPFPLLEDNPLHLLFFFFVVDEASQFCISAQRHLLGY